MSKKFEKWLFTISIYLFWIEIVLTILELYHFWKTDEVQDDIIQNKNVPGNKEISWCNHFALSDKNFSSVIVTKSKQKWLKLRVVSSLYTQYEILCKVFYLLPINHKSLEFIGSFGSHYWLPSCSVGHQSQEKVCHSPTELEYVALSEAAEEVMFFI